MDEDTGSDSNTEDSIRKLFFKRKVLDKIHPNEETIGPNIDDRERLQAEDGSQREGWVPENDVLSRMYTADPPPAGYRPSPSTSSPVHSADSKSEPSSHSDSDVDTGSNKRKKRRRKKANISDVAPGSNSPLVMINSKAAPLSKNQKRKMKKKRRKQRARITDKTNIADDEIGFTFEGTTLELSRHDATKCYEELQEFFRDIWELYDKEEAVSRTDVQVDKITVEQFDKFLRLLTEESLEHNDLNQLLMMKQSLIKNESSRTMEVIDQFRISSQLSPDTLSIIESLMEFWEKDIASLPPNRTGAKTRTV